MTYLKLGAIGEDVKTLQAALRSLGFYKAKIDGTFGLDTEAAVLAFQRSRMLIADGTAGPATWNLLLSPDAHPAPVSAVNQWASWLTLAQDPADPFPIDRALRWIELESGGQACAVGRVIGAHVVEAGLSQVYFDSAETRRYGYTSAELRALCACEGVSQRGGPCSDHAKEEHARVAMQDMMAHRRRARAKLSAAGVTLDEKGTDFLCFIKLCHAIPGLYSYLRPSGAHDWGWFREWVESKKPAELAAIDKGTARYCGSFGRAFDNCEKFAKG